MADTEYNEPRPAGLFRRLGAMFYDSLLLFGVLFAAGGIYSAVHNRLFGGADHPAYTTGQVIDNIQPAATGPAYSLYLLGVIFLFFTLFWIRNGQTLGMQSWRLQLQTEDGSRPGLGVILLRLCAATVSFACAGLGFWWILIDRKRRAWHDIWSHTRIVVLPKA